MCAFSDRLVVFVFDIAVRFCCCLCFFVVVRFLYVAFLLIVVFVGVV